MPESYRVMAPDRFITTSSVESPVVVRFGAFEIMRAAKAVKLSEGALADVYYLPVGAVPDGLLMPSQSVFHCRWKGDAHFFDVQAGPQLILDGAWRYTAAPDDLEAIRECVAFDARHFSLTVEGHREL